MRSATRPPLLRTWATGLLLLLSAASAVAQPVRIETPADSTISYRDRIAVIARAYPGLPLTLTANGLEVQTLQVRPDGRADFLNVLVPPGPVVLKVEQKLSEHLAFADSATIHVIGPAARILLDVNPPSLPADSLSQAEVKAQVVDQWGMPLSHGGMVTIQLDRGTILTADIYPEQPGTQVQVQDGYATVHILSPGNVGEGLLKVTANGVDAQTELSYSLPFQEWTVVGMAGGQVG